MLFSKFDHQLMQITCLKIIQENQYFPNGKEVIDKYTEVKNAVERQRIEKIKFQNRLLVDKQEYCFLCDNNGVCFYIIDEYEYVARCTCPHGNDLNKFGYSQIHSEHVPETKSHYSAQDNEKIKAGINPFYTPTIKEALAGDYYIYEASKQNKRMESLSEDEKRAVLDRFKSLSFKGVGCSV